MVLIISATLEVFQLDDSTGLATVRVRGYNGPRHQIKAEAIGFLKCPCGTWFYPRRMGQFRCVGTCGASERVKAWRAAKESAKGKP